MTNPWIIDEADFYEIETYEQQMQFLLRYAILAPSGHNTQPWSFRITAEGVEVFADYSRRLLIVDRDDRSTRSSTHQWKTPPHAKNCARSSAAPARRKFCSASDRLPQPRNRRRGGRWNR
ncbi:MAG: hypothetical protein M3P06_06960 [Acidobacteriota bacterium]|nr:hypothetical protein [Acidobacteriota bacterium]